MSTIKQVCKQLRLICKDLEKNHSEDRDIFVTLTLSGRQQPTSIFPVTSMRVFEEEKTKALVLDFGCPEPAADYIKFLQMAECGELIKMSAQEELKKLEKTINNMQEVKRDDVTIH